MLQSRSVPLTRRSAVGLLLAGVVGAGLLTACDLDDLRRSTSSDDAPGDDGSAPDPDVATVAAVVVDVRARLAALVEARARSTRLHEPLRALEDMHRAHLHALEPDATPPVPDDPATPPPSGGSGPPAARRTASRVVTAETAHQQSLATAASAVESGALARLLASMSAAVAQHLAALPDLSGGAP